MTVRDLRRASAIVSALMLLMLQSGGARAGDAAAPASEGTPAVVVSNDGLQAIMGKEVVNPAKETFGRIIDVLVSHSGEPRAAVIDFGGFLGVGTRKIAVAWSQLTFRDTVPVLDMTVDQLRVTPEYRSGEPVVIVGSGESPPPPADSKAPADGATPPQPADQK